MFHFKKIFVKKILLKIAVDVVVVTFAEARVG